MITYFFALFPTAAQAVETYAAAVRVQAEHRLRGNLTHLRKLHLTVHFVDRRHERDARLERALKEIGDAITLEPIDLDFAWATSFLHGLASPCVFISNSTPQALERIASDLSSAVAQITNAHRSAYPFRPHVTFLRSRDRIVDNVSIDPIRWRPVRLALAMGRPSAATYEVLWSRAL